jgi:hypothetical protein
MERESDSLLQSRAVGQLSEPIEQRLAEEEGLFKSRAATSRRKHPRLVISRFASSIGIFGAHYEKSAENIIQSSRKSAV